MLNRLCLIVVLFSSVVAFAQQGSYDLLSTAGTLVRYGYSTKSALPIIQAVEIYKKLGIRAEPDVRQKESVADSILDTSVDKSVAPQLDLHQLLEDAVKFADGDSNLLAIIKALDDTKGSTDGPIYHYDTIKPYSTDSYRIAFEGNEPADIIVTGDGDSNLDLYVYDSTGQLIERDNSLVYDCHVSFVPTETAEFIVKVRNLGRMPNCYYLFTN